MGGVVKFSGTISVQQIFLTILVPEQVAFKKTLAQQDELIVQYNDAKSLTTEARLNQLQIIQESRSKMTFKLQHLA